MKRTSNTSLLYFIWGNIAKPLYYGKTIVHEVDTKNPIDLRIGDQGERFFDALHVLPEYIFISVPLFFKQFFLLHGINATIMSQDFVPSCTMHIDGFITHTFKYCLLAAYHSK
jgi:hypothetical protein